MRSAISTTLFIAFMCSLNSANALAPPFPARPVFVNEALWMDRSKKIVKEKLPNAREVDFRKLYIHKTKTGSRFTCGEVRVKHSEKQSEKYRRFITAGRPEVTFFEGQVKDFKSGWQAYCVS